MVGLAQLECKDCYAFEKDKVYCLKIEVPKDYPIENIPNVCKNIVDTFAHQNINVIVLSQREDDLKFEFFKINEKEEGDNE